MGRSAANRVERRGTGSGGGWSRDTVPGKGPFEAGGLNGVMGTGDAAGWPPLIHGPRDAFFDVGCTVGATVPSNGKKGAIVISAF